MFRERESHGFSGGRSIRQEDMDIYKEQEQKVREYAEKLHQKKLSEDDISELAWDYRRSLTDELDKGIDVRQEVEIERDIEKERRDWAEQERDEVKNKSIIDPLTGAYTRGFYNKHFSESVKQAHKAREINEENERRQKKEGPGGKLTLAVFDIDHFKRFNDDYGHQVGDIVLKKLVEVISKNIRQKVDYLYRYGGEEFVLTLDGLEGEEAFKKLDELRQLIEQTELDIGQAKPAEITVSVGFTSLKPEDNPEEVFRRADQSVYLAKKEGRNQVQTLDEGVMEKLDKAQASLVK